MNLVRKPRLWKAAWDARRACLGGARALARRQGARLAEMIAFARRRSAFYRNRYGHLPEGETDLSSLPPVTKEELMENFGDWVTDPEVTREGAEEFVEGKEHIGTLYLDRYVVFATSGTTGRPAVFVHDGGAAAVYLALAAVRRFLPLLSAGSLWSFLVRGGRTATVVATGGHFTSSVIGGLASRRLPRLSGRNHTLSILLPPADLVRELNGFRPAVLGSYPTALAVLARERESGALRIDPALVLSGAERLSGPTRERIGSAFGCPVRDTYAASEFMGIAYDCAHGRLHLNADWAVLEPVDATYRPVPEGQPSHTALLTNLANRVQPIVRYDLGDSVTEVPGPCPCGSPLPGIHVEGRRDEVLHLRTDAGETVAVIPMALATVVEETPGILGYQLIQSGPARIRLRVEEAGGHDREKVLGEASGRLRAYLSTLGLGLVDVEKTEELPLRDAAGGKLRQICAEPGDGAVRPSPPPRI